MLHGKAMAITVAYDMYMECCQGDLDPSWLSRSPTSFHSFREKLAKQMIAYNPRLRRYPGDQHFRISTQQHKRRRPPDSVTSGSSSSAGNFLTARDFAANETRCCEDLSKLIRHIASIEKLPNSSSKLCQVCGDRCYHLCSICGKALHKMPHGGRSVACFFYYHSTALC